MDATGKINMMKDEKGITLVVVALLIVILVAFVGLVVDIGYMYITKGQLQNAADSAALAGASRIPKSPAASQDINAFGNLSSARREAWRFAYNNKVVPSGKSVFLVASSNYNSLPSINLNANNDSAGDIVMGHWNPSTGFTPAPATPPSPTTPSINAIKVVARRTSNPAVPNVSMGDNPVSIFFGRVLGWEQMSASASAIAALPPGATNYILMCYDDTTSIPPTGLECTPACSFPNLPCPTPGGPRTITNQPNPNPPCPNNSNSCKFAWTSLSKPNTPNSWVTNTICSQVFPNEDVCNENIYTTQGQTNSASALETAFYDPNLDTSNKECGPSHVPCTGNNGPVTGWWIIIPLAKTCPPGNQPQPFTVDHFVKIHLIQACHSGGGIPPGCPIYQAPSCPGGGDTITFDQYLCMTCAQKDLITGLKWRLVN